MFQHITISNSNSHHPTIFKKDLAGQNQLLYDQMKKPMQTLALAVLLLSLIIYGCTAEKAPAPDSGITLTACDTAVITSAYILTAVSDKCTSRGCHKGTGSTASTNFTTYAGIKGYITSNEALWKSRVTGADADMPPGSTKLSQGMKDSIDCWISHGMPE